MIFKPAILCFNFFSRSEFRHFRIPKCLENGIFLNPRELMFYWSQLNIKISQNLTELIESSNFDRGNLFFVRCDKKKKKERNRNDIQSRIHAIIAWRLDESSGTGRITVSNSLVRARVCSRIEAHLESHFEPVRYKNGQQICGKNVHTDENGTARSMRVISNDSDRRNCNSPYQGSASRELQRVHTRVFQLG